MTNIDRDAIYQTTPIPADTDTEEVVSEEAKTINLRDLLGTSFSDLDACLSLMRKNHKIVTDYTSSMAKTEKDPKDPTVIVRAALDKAMKADENKALREDRAEKFGHFGNWAFSGINNLVSANVALVEAENLVSLLKAEVAYHLANEVQAQKDRDGIKVSPSENAVESRLVCEALSDHIRKLITVETLTAQLEERDANLPANLYSDGKRKGFNTDVFPRIPRLDLGDAAPVRAFSSLHLEFRFVNNDGVETSHTGSLRQIAHDVVSVGSYRVTGQEIEAALRKAGHGIGATAEEWELEFKSGKLFGKAVAD